MLKLFAALSIFKRSTRK